MIHVGSAPTPLFQGGPGSPSNVSRLIANGVGQLKRVVGDTILAPRPHGNRIAAAPPIVGMPPRSVPGVCVPLTLLPIRVNGLPYSLQ